MLGGPSSASMRLLILISALGALLRPGSASPLVTAGGDEVPTTKPTPLNETIELSERRSFRGYRVLRMKPESDEQLDLLLRLERDEPELDFWKHPSLLNVSVDVMVPPKSLTRLEGMLRASHINKEELISDVESIVTAEREALEEPDLLYRTPNAFIASFFEKYRRINEIHDFLDMIAADNPKIASTFNIGKSYEGRDLRVIKIGSPDMRSKKPVIFIDGGVHAREWVAVTSCLYLAHRLVADYETDPSVAQLVEHYDWYILPVANPDGYEYSHSMDRMWRKTRSLTNSRWGCKGVDPNRNFDFHWNEVGASDNPCSEIYAGPRAFSESETRAIGEFLLSKRGQTKMYLAVHAYSQLWLYPWGYTAKLPDNHLHLEKMAKVALDAIQRKHGTEFKTGSSTNVLYAAAGGSDDWALGVAAIPYSYTVELRDKGRHGFLLPRQHIIPTGEETYEGVKAIAEEIRSLG